MNKIIYKVKMLKHFNASKSNNIRHFCNSSIKYELSHSNKVKLYRKTEKIVSLLNPDKVKFVDSSSAFNKSSIYLHNEFFGQLDKYFKNFSHTKETNFLRSVVKNMNLVKGLLSLTKIDYKINYWNRIKFYFEVITQEISFSTPIKISKKKYLQRLLNKQKIKNKKQGFGYSISPKWLNTNLRKVIDKDLFNIFFSLPFFNNFFIQPGINSHKIPSKNSFFDKFSRVFFNQEPTINVVRSSFDLNISREQLSFWCLDHYFKKVDNCMTSSIKKINTKEDLIEFAKKHPKMQVSCNFGPIHKGDFIFDESTNQCQVDFSRYFSTDLSPNHVVFQGNASIANPFQDFQSDLKIVNGFCYDVENEHFDDKTEKVFEYNQFFSKRIRIFQTQENYIQYNIERIVCFLTIEAIYIFKSNFNNDTEEERSKRFYTYRKTLMKMIPSIIKSMHKESIKSSFTMDTIKSSVFMLKSPLTNKGYSFSDPSFVLCSGYKYDDVPDVNKEYLNFNRFGKVGNIMCRVDNKKIRSTQAIFRNFNKYFYKNNKFNYRKKYFHLSNQEKNIITKEYGYPINCINQHTTEISFLNGKKVDPKLFYNKNTIEMFYLWKVFQNAVSNKKIQSKLSKNKLLFYKLEMKALKKVYLRVKKRYVSKN